MLYLLSQRNLFRLVPFEKRITYVSITSSRHCYVVKHNRSRFMQMPQIMNVVGGRVNEYDQYIY